MSCGVGQRHSSDLELLWLWRRPSAAAPIQPLAWELPCAMDTALKIKQTEKPNLSTSQALCDTCLSSVSWGSRPLYLCVSFYQPSCSPPSQPHAYFTSLVWGDLVLLQDRNWLTGLKTNLWLPKGKGMGWDGLGFWDWHRHTIVYGIFGQWGPDS